MKQFFKDLILGILAGLFISIGCLAKLSTANVVVGAFLFCVGLLVILLFNFNLFTGKICYLLDNDKSYIKLLIATLIGNLLGAFLMGIIFRQTKLSNLLLECNNVVLSKQNDSLLSLFILAIMCNILIYIAVEGFSKSKDVIGKYLSLFFGVMIFVILGFEHSIADMFYFSFSFRFGSDTILRIILIILGNIVGGLFIPLIKKIITKLSFNK